MHHLAARIAEIPTCNREQQISICLKASDSLILFHYPTKQKRKLAENFAGKYVLLLWRKGLLFNHCTSLPKGWGQHPVPSPESSARFAGASSEHHKAAHGNSPPPPPRPGTTARDAKHTWETWHGSKTSRWCLPMSWEGSGALWVQVNLVLRYDRGSLVTQKSYKKVTWHRWDHWLNKSSYILKVLPYFRLLILKIYSFYIL